MSVMNNILDLFRGQAPVTPPQNPAPTGSQTPGQPMPGTASGAGTAPNGTVPNGTVPANTEGSTNSGEQQPQSPMAGFEKVWQAAQVDPNKPSNQVFAKLDPAKVMESAKGVDFAKSLSPELLAQINAGGEGAMAAALQAMNQMSQGVYGQGAITTARLIDEALSKQREQLMAELPGLVRQQAVSENLQKENPIMNNPAIKPLVGALQSQLAVQYPNASAAELQQKVADYFANLGQVFAPKVEPSPESKAGKSSASEDFGSFLL